MVIAYMDNKLNNKELLKFLADNHFSNLELRLLLFWARHPHAKLSIYTIASAMDTARINLRDAISSLVNKCILGEQQNGCGLTTYYLSDDRYMKDMINELSQLDWNQLRNLEQQLQYQAAI